MKARKEQAKEEEDIKLVNVKTPQQVIASDIESAQREEEKREYIASIRRKFKEQHKKLLQGLLEKKRTNDMKVLYSLCPCTDLSSNVLLLLWYSRLNKRLF